MNNKGFTLIEALAVIVLLGIVLAIGGYSVANYLNDSRDKSLHVFKENIKSGMINYYNECKYLSVNDSICKPSGVDVITDYTLNTTVGDLTKFGFIENQGNNEDVDETLIIKNPVDDTDLTNCSVSITYDKQNKKFSEVSYINNDCGSLKNINN